MSIVRLRKFCAVTLFLLCVASGRVSAQSSSSEEENSYIPKIAIKWSPLHVIYFYPSVQIALEHRIFSNTTLQYDAGIIFNNSSSDNRDYIHKRGCRFSAAVRYYLPFTPRVPFYIAVEGNYNRIAFDRDRVIGYHGDSHQDYLYYQYVRYKVETGRKGGGFKIGMLVYFDGKESRFFFDINGGFSLDHVMYKNTGLPPGNYKLFEEESSGFFAPDEANRTLVSPDLSFRLCYKIK